MFIPRSFIVAFVALFAVMMNRTLHVYHQAQSNHPYIKVMTPVPFVALSEEPTFYRRISIHPTDVILEDYLIHFERDIGIDPVYVQNYHPHCKCKSVDALNYGTVTDVNTTHVTVNTLSDDNCEGMSLIINRQKTRIWMLTREGTTFMDRTIVTLLAKAFAINIMYPEHSFYSRL